MLRHTCQNPSFFYFKSSLYMYVTARQTLLWVSSMKSCLFFTPWVKVPSNHIFCDDCPYAVYNQYLTATNTYSTVYKVFEFGQLDNVIPILVLAYLHSSQIYIFFRFCPKQIILTIYNSNSRLRFRWHHSFEIPLALICTYLNTQRCRIIPSWINITKKVLQCRSLNLLDMWRHAVNTKWS